MSLRTVQKLIRMTIFRLLRYFSTGLSSLRYILETRSEGIRNSDSRGCGRSISLRTVTEKSLMPLKTAILIELESILFMLESKTAQIQCPVSEGSYRW